MKDLKMLCLAAITGLGLIAFVGAGTASATTLATDATGSVRYGVQTVIHSTLKSGSSATLETLGGTLIATCTGSTVKGEIEIATGTWVAVGINTLTWEGCSQTTDNVSLGSLEIMQTTGDEGEVRGAGSQVTLSVFGTTCIYGTGGGTTLGTVKGGEAPELAINAIVSRMPGSNTFLCTKESRWTANYIITSPHALHFVG